MQMNYPRYCRYKNPIVLIIIYLSFFNLRDILEWENGKKKIVLFAILEYKMAYTIW